MDLDTHVLVRSGGVLSANGCVLVVTDDQQLCAQLQIIAPQNGFIAASPSDAFPLLETGTFSLAIVDVRASEREVDLIPRVRAQYADIPILAVASDSSVAERVAFLASGADDFVSHISDANDLAARIAVVEHWRRPTRSLVCADGRLRLDPVRRIAIWDGQTQRLSPTEFGILWVLGTRKTPFISISEIAMEVFGSSTKGIVRNCRAHISKTRGKLKRITKSLRIACEVGEGYALVYRP